MEVVAQAAPAQAIELAVVAGITLAAAISQAAPGVRIGVLSEADPEATAEAAPGPAVRAALPAWDLRGVAVAVAVEEEEAAAVVAGGNQFSALGETRTENC
ncbi:MAG: hypothetical protein L0Z53_05170 [Acidobacteriales bacterium]|nr:hypothetical protein [Terriglobales bacterium]